jgi:capsular exopolysaccharide synthesis family protein
LKEVSDKSYRSAEQIAEHLGMPVIGHVPVVKPETKLAKESGSGLDASLISYYRPKSQSSEAFKALRTALYFSNRSSDYKVLQVTSPTPGDGKSTVAANLAISMAQSGKSVVLIDSDLRRPRVQKLFGIENEKGLAWLLTQLPKNPTPELVKELLAEVIVESCSDNLSIIGAGDRPDNPSELLSSVQFDVVMTVLRDLFDLVIVDSPPLLAVTDPSTLASRVDGVLLVVRLKKNAKPVAARASRMLETLEANVIGVVVNGVGSRSAKGYGKYADTDGYYNRGRYYQYGYGYSYGSYSYGKYDEYYSDKDGKKKKKTGKKAEVVSS